MASQGGTGGSERCLVGVNGMCQGGAYDGAWSIIHALEAEIGPLVRVDDGLDQIWKDIGNAGGNVTARARYAGDTLKLGYDTSGVYVNALNEITNNQLLVNPGLLPVAQQNNYADTISSVGAWATLPLTPGTLFAFVLSDISTGQLWTSNNSGAGVGANGYANSSDRDDHMVTYKLTSDPNHYIIAWEDRPLNASDRDYNDLVLELRYVAPVPLPAALPLLVSGLIGFVGLARGRSRRGDRSQDARAIAAAR